MAKPTIMESGTVVMVSAPATAAKLAAQSARLTARGVGNVVFPNQQMATDWKRRVAAVSKALDSGAN